MDYIEKNKKEIDDIIDEILQERVDVDFTNHSSEFVNHFINRDEAERII